MNLNRQSQLKLSQLQVLIAVVDSGSFSEQPYDYRCHSQQSVMRRYSRRGLGTTLSRGRYGAHLTPVGEQIVDRARPDHVPDVRHQSKQT